MKNKYEMIKYIGSFIKPQYDVMVNNDDYIKFTGTILECEAFIRLYEEGIIQ